MVSTIINAIIVGAIIVGLGRLVVRGTQDISLVMCAGQSGRGRSRRR